MAPKKPLKTGGKAGAVPSRPGKPMAGLRDKSARVPASWNAKTVDPTNQRGAGQRPTGGMAGGRAGKPAGKIAGQTPKPAAKPSGQFKAPSVPKPGTPSPRIKVPAEFNARTIYSGANKPRPGAPTTVKGRMAARGPLDAPGRPLQPNSTAKRVNLPKLYNWASRTLTADVRPANKPTAKPAAAAKPKAKPAATTPRVRTTTSYGPPANQIKPKGAGQNILLSNLRNAAKTGLAGLALSALSDKYLSPLARKAGTALGKNVVIPAARALDDAMPGINSRDERMRSNSKAAETGNTSKFAGARDKAFAKAKAIKGSPVLGPKKVGSGGGGGKVGTIAQAFDKSFAAARKAGKSEFTFQGKRYNTKMK
jgi:hypothetical protein